MLSGEVQSDEQAFRQILDRLKGDVGTILLLIPEGKKIGLFPDTAPFWALTRMMFPIAEAVGDLIHCKRATGENLQAVLEKEFEAVRTGYKGRAAILAQLFRHSLTHTDELRSIETNGRKVGWLISWEEQNRHLKVDRNPQGMYVINFDTTAFYDDLVDVCQNAMGVQWSGQVMRQYNKWLTRDLDNSGSGQSVQAAKGEIARL